MLTKSFTMMDISLTTDNELIRVPLEKEEPSLAGLSSQAMHEIGISQSIAYPEILSNGNLIGAETAMSYQPAGFIKIPRSLFVHSGWMSARPKHQFIFLQLLFRAAWAPTSFYWNGNKIDLEVGQLYFSRKSLSEELTAGGDALDHISEADVRGALRYFCKINFLTGEVTKGVTKGPTIVTILYSGFCEQEKTLPNQPPNRLSNQDLTKTSPTKEEDKEKKEEKKRKLARAPDFSSFGKFVKLTTSEYEELSKTHGKPQLDAMIEKINDHCESTGKNYKGFAATIRNWFRREVQLPLPGSPLQHRENNLPSASSKSTVTLSEIESFLRGSYTVVGDKFKRFEVYANSGYSQGNYSMNDLGSFYNWLKEKGIKVPSHWLNS